MKKFPIPAAILLSLAFAACSKGDSGASSNTWSLGSHTYAVVSTSRDASGTILTAKNSAGSTLSLYFQSLPTSAGSFRIVEGPPGAPDELYATVTEGGSLYYSIPEARAGDSSAGATVRVTGGKLFISDPRILVATGLSNSDTVALSVNFTEQ